MKVKWESLWRKTGQMVLLPLMLLVAYYAVEAMKREVGLQ